MKFRTVLTGLAGIGIGYVLGARAGRARFEEIKSQAQRLVSDPDVRQKVADLPNQVKENLPKAQAAVSDAVKAATGKVQGAKKAGGSGDMSAPGSGDAASFSTGDAANFSTGDASTTFASDDPSTIGTGVPPTMGTDVPPSMGTDESSTFTTEQRPNREV